MSKAVKRFYWLPKCTTCQKAKEALEAGGVEIQETVDVKTEPVGKDVIKKLADKVGGVENLFSKRALKYRGMGLHLKTLSDDEMLDLMNEEYTDYLVPEETNVFDHFIPSQGLLF